MALDTCLTRSRGPSGEPVLRLGVSLLDDYLEFLAGRCRPNTVLAAAYDLRVFFTVVAKAPDEVCAADTSVNTGPTSHLCPRAVGPSLAEPRPHPFGPLRPFCWTVPVNAITVLCMHL
jgi:hypothetical protein